MGSTVLSMSRLSLKRLHPLDAFRILEPSGAPGNVRRRSSAPRGAAPPSKDTRTTSTNDLRRRTAASTLHHAPTRRTSPGAPPPPPDDFLFQQAIRRRELFVRGLVDGLGAALPVEARVDRGVGLAGPAGDRPDEGLALRAAGEQLSGDAAPSPETGAIASEQREALLGALEKLREEDQLVIACRYFLDLSEEETAATLGWRRGTVKSRLSRALSRLRQEVGEQVG